MFCYNNERSVNLSQAKACQDFLKHLHIPIFELLFKSSELPFHLFGTDR